MPTYNAEGKRIKSLTPTTYTPYWTRVLQYARGRYHRKQTVFSAEARAEAKDTRRIVSLISAALDVPSGKLFKDDAFVGMVSKFQHYVLDNPNAFAAHICLQKAEQRARFIASQRW